MKMNVRSILLSISTRGATIASEKTATTLDDENQTRSLRRWSVKSSTSAFGWRSVGEKGLLCACVGVPKYSNILEAAG